MILPELAATDKTMYLFHIERWHFIWSKDDAYLSAEPVQGSCSAQVPLQS